MTPSASTHRSKHHRLPGEIIRHAVWRYGRFPLRHRDVEALLCVRGVLGSYEAMRMRCRTCGQSYAHQRRRRRSWSGEQWHVDAVGITMTNEQHALGRAVDQDGVVLDILVQRRQHQQAAKKFFRTLLKGCQYAPRVVIPDKRQSDSSPHDSGNGTCRGARLQASPVKPTVSLGVTSAVGSSCGHDSGQIEHRVAHKLVGH